MIGGERDAVGHLEPVFAALAPGAGAAPPTAGRGGRRSTAELRYYDRKLMETSERFNVYMMLVSAFQPSNMAGLPDGADFEKNRDAAIKKLQDFATEAAEADETLQRMEAPLAVPVANPGEKGRPWVPYATACNKALLLRFLPGQNQTNPALDLLVAIFAAHAKGDAATFNAEVEKWAKVIKAAAIPLQ